MPLPTPPRTSFSQESPTVVTHSGVTPSPATSLPRRRAGGDPLAEAYPTTKPASSACVASAALARRSMCAAPYGRSSSVGMGHPPSYTPPGQPPITVDRPEPSLAPILGRSLSAGLSYFVPSPEWLNLGPAGFHPCRCAAAWCCSSRSRASPMRRIGNRYMNSRTGYECGCRRGIRFTIRASVSAKLSVAGKRS